MSKIREKKRKIVEDLIEKISRQKSVFFFDFSGIKTRNLNELRKNLKESQNELKVAKKSLAQIAFKKSGFDINFKKIKAQLALVFSFRDEISPAKILYKFSEKNPIKILGGIFEGKLIEPEKVIELAKLPTKEELLSRLTLSLGAPLSNFVYVLKANLKGLLNILINLKAQMSNLKTKC